MSDKSVCPRCGYVGPADASYCARCGRALAPLSTRLDGTINRILDNLTPVHLGLLGLLLLILTGMFADHLIVSKLSFSFLLPLVAFTIGSGLAYLGWESYTRSSTRSYLPRMLLVFACIAVSLVGVWLIDRVLLYAFTDGSDMVVYRIPGVYAESDTGSRRALMADVPPYWLAVMSYGVLTAALGNLIHRARKRWSA
jgi:hypothetical protein